MKNVATIAMLGFACLTLPHPALAQKKSKPKPAITKPAEPALPAVCPLATGETLVTLVTSKGPIEVAIDAQRAPITGGNFLRYVDSRKMDGALFYRVMKLGAEGSGEGVIQGGQRNPEKIMPAIAHEPTTQTGLSHVEGSLSMARGAPGSATSDFFVMMKDIKAFDANPSQPGDNLGYAVFGHVTKGMDIVRAIYADPIDPAKGPLVGQMLAAPVDIKRARRTPLLKADDPTCVAATQPVPEAPAATPDSTSST